MKTHLEGKKYSCQFFHHAAVSRDMLSTHMLEVHEDPELLSMMSNQISRVTDSFDLFEVFKEELKNVLNNIIGGHNSVLQELFVIRNNQAQESRFNDIDKSLTKLTALVNSQSSSSSKPPTKTPSSRSVSTQTVSKTIGTARVPMPGISRSSAQAAAAPPQPPKASKFYPKPA